MESDEVALVAVAALSAITTCFVFWRSFQERREWFQPINFVLASFALGFVGKSIYLLAHPSRRSRLLLGLSPIDLVFPTIIACAALWLFSLAYHSQIPSRVAKRIPAIPGQWDPRRTILAVAVLAAIGLVSIAAYVFLTGVPSEFSQIARKRTPPTHYLGLGGNLVSFAFFILFAQALRLRQWSSANVTGIVSLATIAVAFAIYTSSRADLLFLGIVPLILVYYYSRRSVLGPAVILGVILLLVTPLLLGLRAKGGLANPSSLASLDGLLRTVFEPMNMFELVKFSLVVHAVPDQLGYLYGKSLIEWVVFPVPRTLWPDKPVILEAYLQQHLLSSIPGAPTGRLPPGFLGELYLNGGLWLAFPGMLLYGLICGVLLRYRQRGDRNVAVVLSYAIAVYIVAFQLAGGTFARTAIRLLEYGGLLMLVVLAVRTSFPPAASHAPPEGSVAYVSGSNYLQSGAELRMLELAREFRRQGRVVHIVSAQPAATFRQWEDFDRWHIPVHALLVARPPRRRLLRALPAFLPRILVAIIRLYRLVRIKQISIVHVNELLDAYALIPAKLAGARTVCHVRVVFERPWLVRVVLILIARLFADQIVCVSKSVQQQMFGARSRKVVVANDGGPDLEMFRLHDFDGVAEREKHGIGSSELVFVSVGKLAPNKGQMLLLEACLKIIEHRPLPFKLVLVGKGMTGYEAYERELRETAARKELEGKVTLLGVVESVGAVLSSANALVHVPVHHDPFPGVVLEAMAMERAVIASRSGGIPEQVDEGRTAILVERNDCEALARALERAADDPDLLIRMGKEGRRVLLDRFSQRRLYGEIGAIYRSLW